ncbi:MAG: FtsQ-type POTRA domain-containing protein [Gammaproteobacteria bacterium]|nr:FtsQ-type POTRA domain-containing protein [Gammaproteobacteria bacterium]MBL6999435.1 FtsQ-type POTRA domain-containing protein [Gammaproteobacteria bacterium]
MFKLFSLNKTAAVNSRSPEPLKKKPKKKMQASKMQSDTPLDLSWLKPFWQPKVIVGLTLASTILMLSIMLHGKVLLPIERIKISGEFKQLNSDLIERQLSVYLGQDFFSVDIQSIQHLIGQQPWVQTVSIKRIWPNLLQVNVREKKAFARWDDDQLLSTQAEIFSARVADFASLPKINGYSGKTAELLRSYLNLQRQLVGLNIVVTEFREDSKGALSLLLNQTLKVNIGSEQSDMKIRHLIAVYPEQIKPKTEQIKYIDFRYSNGFAIAWKDEYQKQQDEIMQRGNNNV